jgi:hypothetical protein
LAKPIQITVGGPGPYDPAPDTTECLIPVFAGKEIYVEEAGIGTMDYATWENREDGGFNLLVGTFDPGDVFTVHETGKELSQVSSGDTPNYTNGFDFTRVSNALIGRIGWRQPGISGAPVVNDANRATKSGRYFNGFHALCNIMNVRNTCEDPSVTDDTFNDLLQSMYYDIIFRCLNGVFNEPELLEQSMIFNRYGYFDKVVENSSLFIGYEIRIAPKVGFATQIDSAALYFDQAKTFNLYLFKDGVPTPIRTIEVTTVAGAQTVVDFESLVLTYLSGSGNGGRYWFGYFQDDLDGAQALQELVRCWNKTLCFGAFPMQAPKTADETFDRDHRSYTWLPYGLNLTMSSFRDHTEQIIKKAFLFDEVIGLQMASQVVENIMHSTRSNDKERILKDGIDKMMVYMDLKGTVPISEAPSTTGIAKQIERELVRMKKTFFPKPTAKSVDLLCSSTNWSNEYNQDRSRWP